MNIDILLENKVEDEDVSNFNNWYSCNIIEERTGNLRKKWNLMNYTMVETKKNTKKFWPFEVSDLPSIHNETEKM